MTSDYVPHTPALHQYFHNWPSWDIPAENWLDYVNKMANPVYAWHIVCGRMAVLLGSKYEDIFEERWKLNTLGFRIAHAQEAQDLVAYFQGNEEALLQHIIYLMEIDVNGDNPHYPTTRHGLYKDTKDTSTNET